MNTFDSISALYRGRQLTLNTFRSGIFPIKEKQGKVLPSDLARAACVAKVSDCKVFNQMQLKMLTTKQMLQRLPIALAQLKAGNLITENI